MSWSVRHLVVLSSVSLALIACRNVSASEQAVEAVYRSVAVHGAFLNQCRFPNGRIATLLLPVGSDQFALLIHDGVNVADLSTLRNTSKDLVIETNGGQGKQSGVSDIFHELLIGRFEFLDHQKVSAAIFAERKITPCMVKYPF